MNYNPKFKISDLVMVANTGRMYTGYELAARQLKLKNWDGKSYPLHGEIAEVVGVIPHPAGHEESTQTRTIVTVLGIRLKNGKEVVIGQDGCVMFQKFKSKLFDEELFTI